MAKKWRNRAASLFETASIKKSYVRGGGVVAVLLTCSILFFSQWSKKEETGYFLDYIYIVAISAHKGES